MKHSIQKAAILLLCIGSSGWLSAQDNAASYGPANHNVTDRLTKFGVEDPWKNVYLDRWGGGDSYFTYIHSATTYQLHLYTIW